MNDDIQSELIDAARVVSTTGLTDAFGHVSTRTSPNTLAMTPVVPLGLLEADFEPVTVDLTSAELPLRAPKEAWLHIALMHGRPDIGAVCRAQPPSIAAVSALRLKLIPLNGHGAVVGEIAEFPASWLVRDSVIAARVAESIGDADTVILRGNGAVTRGADLAAAVARMWLLERSADLSLRAWAAGAPVALPDDEINWWRAQAGELLPRIYNYLSKTQGKDQR